MFFLFCLCAALAYSCSDENVNTQNVQQKSLLGVDDISSNLETSFKSGLTRSDGRVVKIYPNNYGGSYIENNQFVILVKGGITDDVTLEYRNRTKADNVSLISCEYSFNELNELVNKIDDFFLDERNCTFLDRIKWSYFGINHRENCIEVEMDCTSDNIKEFKQKVSSSSLIKFKQTSGIPICYSKELKPASKINRSNSNSYGSIGYRAKDAQGNVGIVTAGHVPQNKNVMMSFDGEFFDYPTKLQMSGSLDAAFIPYDNTLFTFSNVSRYGGIGITNTLGEFSTGTSVKCEGANSATVKTGQVTDPAARAYLYYIQAGDTVKLQLTDFIKTNCSCKQGDSGGVCYLSSGKPIGIISGGETSLTYMCKISNINSVFGLTMY